MTRELALRARATYAVHPTRLHHSSEECKAKWMDGSLVPCYRTLSLFHSMAWQLAGHGEALLIDHGLLLEIEIVASLDGLLFSTSATATTKECE